METLSDVANRCLAISIIIYLWYYKESQLQMFLKNAQNKLNEEYNWKFIVDDF